MADDPGLTSQASRLHGPRQGGRDRASSHSRRRAGVRLVPGGGVREWAGLDLGPDPRTRSLGLGDGGEIASVNLDATTANPDGSAPARADGEKMSRAGGSGAFAHRGRRILGTGYTGSAARSRVPAEAQVEPRRRITPIPTVVIASLVAPDHFRAAAAGSSAAPGGPRGPEYHAGHRGISVAGTVSRADARTRALALALAATRTFSRGREGAGDHPGHAGGIVAIKSSAILQSFIDFPIIAFIPVAPKPIVEGGDDWAVLQSKMQTLGVSRFTIEGSLAGRVVFSCLIPLAGRQAVTQRFEAEGDDVVGAAQAALGGLPSGGPPSRRAMRRAGRRTATVDDLGWP